MKRIPKNARPIIKVLRRDVRRPKALPRFFTGLQKLCWRSRRWANPPNPSGACCAMGLHPKAKRAFPFFPGDFPYGVIALRTFAKWYDQQTDPQELVDAIWGKK